MSAGSIPAPVDERSTLALPGPQPDGEFGAVETHRASGGQRQRLGENRIQHQVRESEVDPSGAHCGGEVPVSGPWADRRRIARRDGASQPPPGEMPAQDRLAGRIRCVGNDRESPTGHGTRHDRVLQACCFGKRA